MAKKKTKVDEEELDLNETERLLSKKFGDSIFISANTVIDRKKTIISVSPAVDVAIGGGIPEGSFVVLTAKPKVGKTSLALRLASNAQRIPSKWGIRKTYYLNIEGRIKERDLKANELLLDDDHFKLVSSSPGNILSGEAFIEIAENIIKGEPGAVVILDSISAICTEGEFTSDLSQRYRADSPLLLAKFCRRINQIIGINDCIVINITHIMANMGYGHKTTTEASGTKVQYQNDVKLLGKMTKPWMQGDVQVGSEITWLCENSALIGPGRTCTGYLRFGTGIDEYMELATLAIDLGIAKRGSKGGWIKLQIDEEEINIQGKEGLCDYMKANEEFTTQVKERLKDLYGC